MLPASSKFRPATPDDKTWVFELFALYKQLGGGPAWFRFWQAKNPREHWIVNDDKTAFCHYLVALDGTRSVYEIVVHPTVQRTGLGTAMLETVGTPVRLKTNLENEASNAFYAKSGFMCLAKHKKRKSDGISKVWYKG